MTTNVKKEIDFEENIGGTKVILYSVYGTKSTVPESHDIYIDDIFVESIPAKLPKSVASNAFQLAVHKWSTVKDTIEALTKSNKMR